MQRLKLLGTSLTASWLVLATIASAEPVATTTTPKKHAECQGTKVKTACNQAADVKDLVKSRQVPSTGSGLQDAPAGTTAGSAPDPNLSDTIGKANVARTPGLAGPALRGGTLARPGGMDGTPAGVAPLPGVSPEGNDNDNVPGKNTNVRVVDGAAGSTGVAAGTPLPGVSPEGNDNGGRDGNDNGGGPPVSGPENSQALMVGGEPGGGIVRPPNQYGNKNENPPGKNDNTRLTGGLLAHPEDEPAEPAPRGGNTNGPRLQGLYGKSPDNDNKAGGGIKIDLSDAQLARDAQAQLAARFGAAAAAHLRVSANAGVVRVEAMAGNSLGRAQIDAALQDLPATRDIDVP